MKACLYISIILCFSIISCSKKKFLDERPKSELFVPTTLEDFQAMLDNDVVLSLTPVLGELSADNFYIIPTFWQNLSNIEQNAYVWSPDIFNGEGNIPDWNAPYKQVLYANVVLDGLTKVDSTSDNWKEWCHIKGSALFTRAYAFYNLAQVFALPYNSAIATTENTGIPLKLTPNVDESIKRSTLEETYARILNDLLEAKKLLADSVTSYRNRPNKPAALAQLARVYLSMRKYNEAGAYADSCLKLYNELIDYNTRDGAARPFDRLNAETMYQSRFVETNALKGVVGHAAIDSTLFSSYAQDDLRRNIFILISQGKRFNRSYTGLIQAFTGLATDETYLIRAECRARAGDVNGAMQDLNTLLIKRWKTGTFIPYTASTAEQAKEIILLERRKEMPCRGVRWTDIRRLNLEDANIKPKRIINTQPYELQPNSLKYAILIPPDAVVMGQYKQNDR
jgi:tetratricopeptide (TPR) repeat protein